MWRRALELIPEEIQRKAEGFPLEKAEEIRLRCGKPPYVLVEGEERLLCKLSVDRLMLERVMERATGASLHAVGQALREGYLSYRGIRVGICGMAVVNNGHLETVHNITSVSIRIPKACLGIGEILIRQLYPEHVFSNTILLSPPGGGKTTTLRDLIRCLSQEGYRVSVVDERNEISATDGTEPAFDLGAHTDVMVGAPKEAAVAMLLRAMNPQILAMDEISTEHDCELVRRIVGCGVGLLATAHAAGLDDLKRRPSYRSLLRESIFTQAVVIQQSAGVRSFQVEHLAV